MSDSDEEEFYLLQPTANEYNIADKVKEANQELYSQPKVTQNSANRRVRFREQLEDFEPEDNSEDDESHSQHSNQRNLEQDNISEVSSDDGYGESNNSDIERTMEEINCEEIEEVISNKSDPENEEVSEVCEQLEDELNLEADEKSSQNRQESIEVLELEQHKVPQKPEKSSKSSEKSKRKTEIDADEPTGIQRCFPKRYRPKSAKIKPAAEVESEKKVKDCCEHKHSNEYRSKLPNYNGYYSIYGLSQEQLEKKEEQEQKILHLKQMKEMEKSENKKLQETLKEEAFRKWLYEKMRHPINKSKNMFDVNYSKYILKCRQRRKSRKPSRVEPSPDPEEYNEDQPYDDPGENQMDEVQDFRCEDDSQEEVQHEENEDHEVQNEDIQNNQEEQEDENEEDENEEDDDEEEEK